MTNLLFPCVISVEDDDDLYRLIQLSLKSLPIRLLHAETGHIALNLLRQQEVHLLILDIMLPDIHGWNVLKQMAAEKTNTNLRGVIVLTAQTSATHRVIAHLQDVTAYINKPFSPHLLRQKVIDILRLPV